MTSPELDVEAEVHYEADEVVLTLFGVLPGDLRDEVNAITAAAVVKGVEVVLTAPLGPRRIVDGAPRLPDAPRGGTRMLTALTENIPDLATEVEFRRPSHIGHFGAGARPTA